MRPRLRRWMTITRGHGRERLEKAAGGMPTTWPSTWRTLPPARKAKARAHIAVAG